MNNIVKFPLFNLTININKTAFSIFGIDIYWYAVLMVSAMVLALLMLKRRDGLFGIKYNDVLELVLYLIPISLIFARLYYVIFKLNYYTNYPLEIINIRNGGMAIYGGIIGGILTCIIFCRKKNIAFLDIIDYLAPGLVLGQAIGRWGNFINIEAYGIETKLPWRMGIYEMGKYIEVHPTFLYESLACLIIFAIIIIKSNNRQFPGQIAYIYLILYSFERIFVEGLRSDSLMIGVFRVSQLLSIIILAFTVILYINTDIKKCRKSSIKKD